jgi:DNA-binding NtrC family response regulator
VHNVDDMGTEIHDSSKPIRLILIDDEVGFATVMAKRLARRGYDVTTAFSGSEAIRAMRKSEFDVAVLDLKMEDMDGIEVLKIFKKLDPAMPVIMLTGHGSEKSASEGMEYGAYDYLFKPYEFEELLEKIREAVSSKKE